MALHIVLIEPEIPHNTGAIARTCAATGTVLHLVKPLGFSISDKYLKRAGLDYWDLVEVVVHENFDELLDTVDHNRFFFATTKGGHRHSDFSYVDECYLVFGKETKGIDKDLLNRFEEHNVRIPMRNIEKARSLNLANSVNIVLYEALRQLDYPGLR
ncbi:tRNA (uridine(34)/cytosine(34)/5-carboxymethylaminomethyluridine (34)-2'-O)-methyltransferase TrmL [Gottschalkiaceae bacterium SANA]|nr:tRNA (uridine(34)/cytosine(34)/5-carboxymethylaminomethyluridine (34)-2'-O)-methyltransferase TrmL [Gottschalkiaceae bacterium SANA]